MTNKYFVSFAMLGMSISGIKVLMLAFLPLVHVSHYYTLFEFDFLCS